MGFLRDHEANRAVASSCRSAIKAAQLRSPRGSIQRLGSILPRYAQ